jgi:molybdopterin molybdotransferase
VISVREAQDRILSRVTGPLPPELIAIGRALGRVLAEDFRAPFDVPPADNSAVDGYAIASVDIPEADTRELDVVADLPAGSVYPAVLRPGQAIRIMTGAPLPAGADTVVPVEATLRVDGRVRIGPIPKRVNVRNRGEDVRAGSAVVEAGTVLRPQEVGLLASLGSSQIPVRRRPRVAILSTGDEVVDPGHPRRAGQIFDSNRYMLRAAVEQCGGDPLDLDIAPDDRRELAARLSDASQAGDIVISSGGVSVGDFDLVKDVLREIGGVDFWQVAMQPGRPLAAGRIGAAHFFGLPGNPVASMLTFSLFVRPVILKLSGRRELFPPVFQARAAETLAKKPGRREFKRGILTYRDGGWEVRSTGPQGSGILSSLCAGNCLVVIEEERGDVQLGETVWVEPFPGA